MAMTLQEIFDVAVTGLLKQGKKSMQTTGACAYRGVEGCKCAVGFLIKDEFYDRIMDVDTMSVRTTTVEAALVNSGVLEGCNVHGFEALDEAQGREVMRLRLLGDLQYVHDQEFKGNWKEGFLGIADNYRLKTDHLFDMSNTEEA